MSSYYTSHIFHKNQILTKIPNEICYECKSSPNTKWIRYCVFNIADKTVMMERCEGYFFDGYEQIQIDPKTMDFIISVAPDIITLSRDEKGWV